MIFLIERPRRLLFFVAAVGMIFLKLWLVASQPVVAHGNAFFDDRLFLALARQLVDGRWLGPYSQFTLMKGPMYPFFIAGTFWMRLPLPVAQHLLYLLGCVLLVLALRPRFRAGWQAFALFLLLWWQPMSYTVMDVLRQQIYTPLTLLLFAGSIAFETRRVATVAVRAGWGVLLGASAAAFYLTREEGVWVMPGAGLLIGAAAWNSWRAGERLRPLFAPSLTAISSAVAIIGAVCALNLHYYGWFGTVEFRAPEFLSAYGALQRPIPSKDAPYVPVTREVRARIYEVSPAFAELKPWLEGTIGLAWADTSDEFVGPTGEEREIAGGWFMWALRDAVAAAGHAQNAREALDFYKRVGLEVNRASDEGRLGPARKRHDTMIPPWRPEFTQRLLRSWRDYLEYFVLFRDFTALPADSTGSAELLRLFRDLTRWPLAPSADAPELIVQQSRLDRLRLTTLQDLGVGFRWLCVIVIITGVVAWSWAATRTIRRRTNVYLSVVASAALGSAFAVVLVNFLVHILSFPNQNPVALHQSYPLLVLSGTVAWIVVMGAAQPAPSD